MNNYSAFDNLFDPLLVLNKNEEIIYFNHQSTIFFKLPPRLLKQQNKIHNLIQVAELNLNEWIKEAIKVKDVTLSSELQINLSHDTDIEYFVILKMIPSEDGETFTLIFHDVTVEKNLHLKYREQLEELKKTHNQILQADKLTTLGELTANISHEINNPLTIAAGHSEIIRDFLNLPNPLEKLKQMQTANANVIESLERVNQIIRNMKDFLHQSEDQKEYCDLETLLDTAIEWIQPNAKKAKVKIIKHVQEQKMVALINRVKIEQVLINLIKNSIDALTESHKNNNEIHISIKKSDADRIMMIDVVDTGPGLPNIIKENLFKPFTSTKESGTGMGLSICAKIIDAHRGKLTYIDTPTGCHFRITLPLIEVYSYTRNDKSLSGLKKQKRILVLDNEVQILNVLSTFIKEEGLVFIGSSNPLDALDFIQKASIDLIITDFSMPIMTGSEFATKVREYGYKGAILYMTSQKFINQYNNDKNNLDISGMIVKPFNKDDVMKTIKMALTPQKEQV